MKLILILILCFPQIILATTIDGIASEHVGHTIRLLRYEDYITNKTLEVAKTTVNTDSTFSISFETDEIFQAILEVGNVYAYIYVQPEANYEVGVPAIQDHAKRLNHNNIQLIFTKVPDTNDINYLILDFDYQLDLFFSRNVDIMGSRDWSIYLDSFKNHLSRIYKDIDNGYFINYMSFSTVQMELIGNPKLDVGVNMELIYDTYLNESPVFHQHSAYMMVVNNFYKNIFESVSVFHERALMKAVILENEDSIMAVLKHYKHYQNHELTELVVIKALGESYMNNKMPRSSVLNILTDMSETAHYKTHKTIAKNMIKKLTKLRKGYPAYNFILPDKYGKDISLNDFKGKYTYVTFFEPWSSQSLSDFKIMVKLKERYPSNIEMISICTGPDSESFSTFIKANTNYDWTFLNGYNHADLIEYYDINTYPAYFLIDPEGNLIQAPALSPSPRGNYDSIDKVMYNIDKRAKLKDQSRPPGVLGGPPPGTRRH